MGATISKKNTEFVENEIDNVKSNVIRITEDKLRIKISEYEKSRNHSDDWIGACGLVISISLSLLTAKFEDKYGIQGEIWCFLFVLFLIGSIIYLIITISKCRKRKTIEDFLKDIKR